MPQNIIPPRFCHKCGKEIPKGSSYCKICRIKVVDNPPKK